jgi:hypothetical protein
LKRLEKSSGDIKLPAADFAVNQKTSFGLRIRRK